MTDSLTIDSESAMQLLYSYYKYYHYGGTRSPAYHAGSFAAIAAQCVYRVREHLKEFMELLKLLGSVPGEALEGALDHFSPEGYLDTTKEIQRMLIKDHSAICAELRRLFDAQRERLAEFAAEWLQAPDDPDAGYRLIEDWVLRAVRSESVEDDDYSRAFALACSSMLLLPLQEYTHRVFEGFARDHAWRYNSNYHENVANMLSGELCFDCTAWDFGNFNPPTFFGFQEDLSLDERFSALIGDPYAAERCGYTEANCPTPVGVVRHALLECLADAVFAVDAKKDEVEQAMSLLDPQSGFIVERIPGGETTHQPEEDTIYAPSESTDTDPEGYSPSSTSNVPKGQLELSDSIDGVAVSALYAHRGSGKLLARMADSPRWKSIRATIGMFTDGTNHNLLNNELPLHERVFGPRIPAEKYSLDLLWADNASGYWLCFADSLQADSQRLIEFAAEQAEGLHVPHTLVWWPSIESICELLWGRLPESILRMKTPPDQTAGIWDLDPCLWPEWPVAPGAISKTGNPLTGMSLYMGHLAKAIAEALGAPNSAGLLARVLPRKMIDKMLQSSWRKIEEDPENKHTFAGRLWDAHMRILAGAMAIATQEKGDEALELHTALAKKVKGHWPEVGLLQQVDLHKGTDKMPAKLGLWMKTHRQLVDTFMVSLAEGHPRGLAGVWLVNDQVKPLFTAQVAKLPAPAGANPQRGLSYSPPQGGAQSQRTQPYSVSQKTQEPPKGARQRPAWLTDQPQGPDRVATTHLSIDSTRYRVVHGASKGPVGSLAKPKKIGLGQGRGGLGLKPKPPQKPPEEEPPEEEEENDFLS